MPTGRPDDDWFFLTLMKQAGAEQTWKRHPIGGEIRPEVWGCCFDEKPCTPAGQDFATCRDATHVTWLMDTGLFEQAPSPERHRRAEDAIRKMGYEFHADRRGSHCRD